MHKIDGSGNISGAFTEGDPLAHPIVPATVVTDDWLNAVQTEIVNVIEGAGIALDKPTNTQLLSAIKMLAGRGYKRQLTMANYNDLSSFLAGTIYDLGIYYSSGGEIAHSSGISTGHSLLYSMAIQVVPSGGHTFEMNVFANDDNIYIYIDGVLSNSRTDSESHVAYPVTLAQGTHIVEVLLNNDGNNETDLLFGAWIDGTNIKWLRASRT